MQHQSPVLETILLLRELDVSIDEIQTFLKDRSAEKMKVLLEERTAKLDLQIMHLQALRKTLSNHTRNMETLLTMDLSEIRVTEKEECLLVTVDIDEHTTFEKEVELITAETARYRLERHPEAL